MGNLIILSINTQHLDKDTLIILLIFLIKRIMKINQCCGAHIPDLHLVLNVIVQWDFKEVGIQIFSLHFLIMLVNIQI